MEAGYGWREITSQYANSPPDSPKVFQNISNILLDLGRIFLTVLVASEMLDIFLVRNGVLNIAVVIE